MEGQGAKKIFNWDPKSTMHYHTLPRLVTGPRYWARPSRYGHYGGRVLFLEHSLPSIFPLPRWLWNLSLPHLVVTQTWVTLDSNLFVGSCNFWVAPPMFFTQLQKDRIDQNKDSIPITGTLIPRRGPLGKCGTWRACQCFSR